MHHQNPKSGFDFLRVRQKINRLRVFKTDNRYGPWTIQLSYAVDESPTFQSIWYNTEIISRGYNGTEIDTTGNIGFEGSIESHNWNGGWFSIIVNPVNASALRLSFTSSGYNHYATNEVEIYGP